MHGLLSPGSERYYTLLPRRCLPRECHLGEASALEVEWGWWTLWMCAKKTILNPGTQLKRGRRQTEPKVCVCVLIMSFKNYWVTRKTGAWWGAGGGGLSLGLPVCEVPVRAKEGKIEAVDDVCSWRCWGLILLVPTILAESFPHPLPARGEIIASFFFYSWKGAGSISPTTLMKEARDPPNAFVSQTW